MIERAYINFT